MLTHTENWIFRLNYLIKELEYVVSPNLLGAHLTVGIHRVWWCHKFNGKYARVYKNQNLRNAMWYYAGDKICRSFLLSYEKCFSHVSFSFFLPFNFFILLFPTPLLQSVFQCFTPKGNSMMNALYIKHVEILNIFLHIKPTNFINLISYKYPMCFIKLK